LNFMELKVIKSDVSTDFEDDYHDSEGDLIYLESLLIKDTILNLPPEVFLDRDPRSLEDEPDKDDFKNTVKFLEADIILTRLTFTKPRWRSSSLPLAIIRGERSKVQIGRLGIKGWDGSLGTLLETFGKAILTLVERVKSLEVALKRKTKRVLFSDSEEEETEAQGRINIGDINTDVEITLIDETQGRINDIIANEDITLIPKLIIKLLKM
ncbi:hypothetical protein Tco_1370265, partial [Tanacetum coccineum]